MSAVLPKDTQLEQIRRFHAAHKIITILSQSKSNTENLLDNLPEIFAIINVDGYIAKGNNLLAKYMGTDVEGLLGKSISSLFETKNWQQLQDKINGLKSTKESAEIELSCPNIYGNQERIFIWRVSLFRAVNILKPLYCIMAIDITTLRQREHELEVFNANLKSMVEEKTQDIAELLDSIDHGILSIGPGGNFHETHSKGAEHIFGTTSFGNKTVADLFEFSAHENNEFLSWVALIASPGRASKFKKLEALCPLRERMVTSPEGSRHIIVSYKPILKAGTFDRLMMICSDITERKKIEQKIADTEQANNLKLQRILGLVNNLQVSLTLFFDELAAMRTDFHSVTSDILLKQQAEELFRAAHTLKGNAGSFGFTELAHLAGTLEDALSRIIRDKKPASEVFQDWRASLTMLSNEIDELVKLRESLFVESTELTKIPLGGYRDLLSKIKKQYPDKKDLLYEIIMLERHPFKDFCQKYNNIIRIYRASINKNIRDLIVIGESNLIHKRIMAILDTAIIHIIRNAIDHGIESDEIRQDLNKGAGTISISYTSSDNRDIITITDDGAGLDIDRVAAKAITLGLVDAAEVAKMNSTQKTALIYLTGLSTKDTVDSLSGRGAGLGAAKEILDENHGTIELVTTPGQGCSFTLSIDRSKALQDIEV